MVSRIQTPTMETAPMRWLGLFGFGNMLAALGKPLHTVSPVIMLEFPIGLLA